ncbi:general substrate transporter [Kockovaella imperatae]|uniref:General substrate transporter n=1 Tax=Kockovaella imperatae TaxID=4999 RepID=A0A1Y1UPW0_9TREE|nr:general substrate transporter [Kockovaella imperatae]ORX39544.1 general substrate transporter [Kockovaella imperatae]
MSAPNEDISKYDSTYDEDAKSRVRAHQKIDGHELKSEFDVLTVPQVMWKFRKALSFGVIIGVTALADGYAGMINGVIIANPGFVKQFGTVTTPDGTKALAPSIVSAWGAVQAAAQILTSLTFSTFSDRYGRKVTFYTVWALTAISFVTFQVCTEWKLFLVSRIFGGAGLGAAQSLAPSYICEFAPVRTRGLALLVYYICNSLGLLMGPVVMEILSRTQPENYKIAIYTQWPVLAYMAFAYLYVPESHWFYAIHDQDEKAKKTMRRAYGKIENYDIDTEYAIIKNTLMEERAQNSYGTLQDVLKSYVAVFQGRNKWRLIAGTVPLMCCQLSGVNLFGNYSAYFFSLAGFSNPYLVQVLIFGSTLATQCVTAFVVEYVGRRRLVFIGAIVDCICCAVIGLIGSLGKTLVLKDFVIAVTMIWAVFNTFLGTLGGSYTAEAPSSRMRTRSAGISQGGVAIIGLALTIGIPYMINPPANLGLKSGWVFAGLMFPMCFAVYFLVPDFTGRSPSELDELWEARIPAWRFHKTKTNIQLDLQQRMEYEKAMSGTPAVLTED